MRDFHFPGRSPVWAESGACATSHQLAAQIAVRCLQEGGNAMDAAIAGAAVMSVCEPPMTGLGGDCFALVKPAGAEDILGYNGSGRAPTAADAQALRDRGLTAVPPEDPQAVTIPGAVEGFCRMHGLWGRRELGAVLAPAIHHMEAGVPIAPRVAWDYAAKAHVLGDTARRHYLPWDRLPKPGDILRLPGQAEVLRRVAKSGEAAFYEGEVADDIIAALRAQGGRHDADDFAAHRGTETTPVSGSYQGTELWEHPPNGQGATAILLAHILAQFDVAGMDPFGAERAHIEAEATRLAYDARNRFLSDPDHMARLDHMLDPDTGARLAALINPKRATAELTKLSEQVHRDTIYITVVDRDRMAVSLIYSIFRGFGSGIATEKFGTLLQNRGSGFSLEAGHANELAPGKRPMHTIIPGMLKQDGRVIMPFGVMGGAYQANGHARFLSNIVDFGMDPQAAIDAPRAFAQADLLSVERGYSAEVRQALADLGHRVEIPDEAIGGAQAIRLHDNGYLEAGSDPRKDGCAIGY